MVAIDIFFVMITNNIVTVTISISIVMVIKNIIAFVIVNTIDLVIQVYTNKLMLVGVFLDPRRSSSTSKFAESGTYEAFVVVQCSQLQLIQPQIITNKHDRVTFTTSSRINFQFLLAALQKNTPGSVLLGIKQMPCIVLLS